MRAKHANTTALIGAWSMDGAHGDLDGRFHSVVDIHAVVAERSAEPADSAPPTERSPLLLKLAGDDDWLPLPAAAH
jgi:hypothetical protein